MKGEKGSTSRRGRTGAADLKPTRTVSEVLQAFQVGAPHYDNDDGARKRGSRCAAIGGRLIRPFPLDKLVMVERA
jgi:hypothetical protein